MAPEAAVGTQSLGGAGAAYKLWLELVSIASMFYRSGEMPSSDYLYSMSGNTLVNEFVLGL